MHAREERLPVGAGCPVHFGDVVLLSDGSLGVVHLPVRGRGLLACLELDELGRMPAPPYRETVIAPWDSVERKLGTADELAADLRRVLDPHRRGVLLGETPWETGVELLDEGERALLAGGGWEALVPTTRELVERLFGPAPAPAPARGAAGAPCWRAFVHTGEEWSGWRMIGPDTRERCVAQVAELTRRAPRPESLAPGVYAARPDAVTHVEIYRHHTRVEERRFLRGQGEG